MFNIAAQQQAALAQQQAAMAQSQAAMAQQQGAYGGAPMATAVPVAASGRPGNLTNNGTTIAMAAQTLQAQRDILVLSRRRERRSQAYH